MPRIRTLKPDFWSDRRMVKLSPYARLFYMGMWNFALCDRGHLPDDAEELKLKILPVDDVDPDALLAELVDADRIRRYTTPDGETYLWAWKLAQHQKVDGRWQPRCPYCALGVSPDRPAPHPNSRESPGARTDSPEPASEPERQTANGTPSDSQIHAEPHPNSGEFLRDSPELPETPAVSPELPGEGKEGKGREGSSGGTAPLKSSGRGRPSEPPPEDSSPRSWTETLLAEHCTKQRRPPPAKERSKIAEQIHALLTDEEPFTADEVRTVLDVWSGRPVGPGVIGSIADELFCRRDATVTALDRQRALPASRASPSGTDANLNGWAQTVAQLQAAEGGPR